MTFAPIICLPVYIPRLATTSQPGYYRSFRLDLLLLLDARRYRDVFSNSYSVTDNLEYLQLSMHRTHTLIVPWREASALLHCGRQMTEYKDFCAFTLSPNPGYLFATLWWGLHLSKSPIHPIVSFGEKVCLFITIDFDDQY